MHLKYEIRICPKNYNKVTMTLYFYYEIACIRRYVGKGTPKKNKNAFFPLIYRRNGDHSTRDIFNEKPTHEDKVAVLEESTAPKLYENATIHTDQGDIICKLFPR